MKSSLTHRPLRLPEVVPFCGVYLESYKGNPKKELLRGLWVVSYSVDRPLLHGRFFWGEIGVSRESRVRAQGFRGFGFNGLGFRVWGLWV